MARQSQAERYKSVLAELGGSAGNGRLREALGWSEGTYERTKQALLAEGVIFLGRGRGGSVSLSSLETRKSDALPHSGKAVKSVRDVGTQNVKEVRPPSATGSDLGFETNLFKAADKLRGNMEPSDYKHVALGLIFLKHISESFEAKRANLLADYPDGAEDP